SFRLCEPGSAERRRSALWRFRQFRQPERLYREGPGRRWHRPDLRYADEIEPRRAGERVWPCRRKRAPSEGLFLRHLYAASRGALARRREDHGGRRHLDIQYAEEEPPLLQRLLR